MNRKLLPLIISAVLLWCANSHASWDYDAPPPWNHADRYFFITALEEYRNMAAAQAYTPQPPFALETCLPYDARAEMLSGWPELIGLADDDLAGQQDLYDLIIQITPAELQLLAKAVNEEQTTSHWTNRAAQVIADTKNREALEYLLFMRELEDKNCLEHSAWRYAEVKPDENCAAEMAARALQSYQNAAKPNLAMRYAFQYIRLLFYTEQYAEAIAFFETEIADKPDGFIKEWCRSFYAGSLYGTKEYYKAYAGFAKICFSSARYLETALSSLTLLHQDADITLYYKYGTFNPYYWQGFWRESMSEDERWLYLLKSYHEVIGRTLKRVLVHTDSEAEAAMVNYVQCYFYKDFTGMLLCLPVLAQNGYEPFHDLEAYLASFISRHNYRGYSQPYPPVAYKELARLMLIVAEYRPAPAFWQLGAAHAALLAQDYDAALQYIELAKINSAERDFPRQLLVTRLLAEIQLGKLDAASEKLIADLFTQMDTTPPTGETRLALLETLSKRYKDINCLDYYFFALAVVNDDAGGNHNKEFSTVWRSFETYWAKRELPPILSDPAVLTDLIRIVKTPQNELEEYFLSHTVGWRADILYELLGLAYLNQHNFANAAEAFSRMEHEAFTHYQAEYYAQLANKNMLQKAWHAVLGWFNAGPKHNAEAFALAAASNWCQERYQSKTQTKWKNPLLNNHAGEYNTDAYTAMYLEGLQTGLSPEMAQIIQDLTQEPQTFREFARSMQELKVLAANDDETGALAAYFHAVGANNIHHQFYWHLYERYKWQPQDYEYILQYARQALSTQNRELAARAMVMEIYADRSLQALLGNYVLDFKKSSEGYKYYDTVDVNDSYYRTLRNYEDTGFGQLLIFSCPGIASFMN